MTPFVESPGGDLPDTLKGDPKMARMAVGIGVPGAERSKTVHGAKKPADRYEFEVEVTETKKEYDFDCKSS